MQLDIMVASAKEVLAPIAINSIAVGARIHWANGNNCSLKKGELG
jgi:hypothetical protein